MKRGRSTSLLALVWLIAGCSDAATSVDGSCAGCDMAGVAVGGGGCVAACDMGGGGGGGGDGGDSCGGDPSCSFLFHEYRRGRDALGLYTAFLDGKTVPALVVSHSWDISVRLGAKGGSFAPETVYDVGPFPHVFAAGDFDGDGQIDLAVGSGVAKTVTPLLNVGSGLLHATTALPLDGKIVALAAGDLDRNGRADLVALVVNPNELVVFLDAGMGGFAPPHVIALNKELHTLAVVDFDHDGKLDVVAVGLEAQIFPGNGDGTLQAETGYTAPFFAEKLIAADFTGDGAYDLAIAGGFQGAGGAEGEIAILVNNGTGGIKSSSHFAFGGVPVQAIVAGDFDQNGKADLVGATSSGSALTLLPGNGDGSFGAGVDLPFQLDSGQTSSLASIATADFDNDGKIDLALASYAGWVGTLHGRGDGGFDTGWYGNVGYRAPAIGDSDGDGHADVVVSSSYPTLTTVLRGDGTGALGPPDDERVPAGATVMTAGDFDGDGKLDVVAGGPTGMSVRWGGQGGFVPLSALSSYVAAALATGDLTGDGIADVIVAGTHELRVLPGRADRVLASAAPFSLGSGPQPTLIAVGDFDHDGKRDCVVNSLMANGVTFVAGAGDGTFARSVASLTALMPLSLAAGDFDGGDVDLVITVDPTTVQLAHGNGDGSFTAGATFDTMPRRAFSVVAGDVDGDQHLDLIVAEGKDGDAALELWRGDGTGAFARQLTYARPWLPLTMTLGDLDGDGKPDLAFVDVDGLTTVLNRLR